MDCLKSITVKHGAHLPTLWITWNIVDLCKSYTKFYQRAKRVQYSQHYILSTTLFLNKYKNSKPSSCMAHGLRNAKKILNICLRYRNNTEVQYKILVSISDWPSALASLSLYGRTMVVQYKTLHLLTGGTARSLPFTSLTKPRTKMKNFYNCHTIPLSLRLWVQYSSGQWSLTEGDLASSRQPRQKKGGWDESLGKFQMEKEKGDKA